MAAEGGRNTKIAQSRLGCRLPFESADVGNGYAGSGPCLVRKMTPEEMARYGAAQDSKRILTKAAVKWAVEHADSPAEAAMKLNITEKHLSFEMNRHCIAVPEEWKEDDTVDDLNKTVDNSLKRLDGIVHADTESQENQASRVDEKQDGADKVVQGEPAEAQEDKPKTRREILLEKLTKERYLELKKEGLSDRAVLKEIGVPPWTDILTDVKHKWGLTVAVISPQRQESEPAGEVPPAQTPPAGLTIAQAVELREELAEDVASLRRILDVALRGAELTGRVVQMIETQWSIHKSALDRINEVFEKTVLSL